MSADTQRTMLHHAEAVDRDIRGLEACLPASLSEADFSRLAELRQERAEIVRALQLAQQAQAEEEAQARRRRSRFGVCRGRSPCPANSWDIAAFQ